jgi:hypothetical protein
MLGFETNQPTNARGSRSRYTYLKMFGVVYIGIEEIQELEYKNTWICVKSIIVGLHKIPKGLDQKMLGNKRL